MWKILLIDDNALNRELIKEYLDGVADCTEVNNGVDGLNYFIKSKKDDVQFDVILLDISMPGMDGVTVLKKIRDFEHKEGISDDNRVPIIMETAFSEPQLRSFNTGCDDYILSPIKRSDLISKIERLVKKKK